MKNIIQILFFALVAFPGLSQNRDSLRHRYEEESQWSVQLLGGPNYCYPTTYFHPVPEREGLYKYHIIAMASQHIKKLFFLNYGLAYNALHFKTIQISNLETSYYDYRFLNLSISGRLVTSHNRIFGNLDAGISGNLLLYNIYYRPHDNFSRSFYNNGAIAVSWFLSPGINFNMTNRITFGLSALYSHAFVPITFIDAKGSVYERVVRHYVEYSAFNLGVQYYIK